MLGIGLYGDNGHQIGALEGHPRARVVAVAGLNSSSSSSSAGVARYGTLTDLLRDDRVRLVSLCSPRRSEQAQDAIECLRAGRAVYGEKPAALTEGDLDRILTEAELAGQPFHEMAGTAFQQPYQTMRTLVAEQTIGQVVQVFAQKSYPDHDARPLDDNIDGGLIRWCGIHAVRLIEHVAGSQVSGVDAVTTTAGDRRAPGILTRAATVTMTLCSGGLATAVINYLNPAGFGSWGNDHLRIFGTGGLIEATDGGTRTRLVVGERDYGPLTISDSGIDYLESYITHLLDNIPMPMSLDEELHPTRIVIRAHNAATRSIPIRGLDSGSEPRYALGDRGGRCNKKGS